MHFVPIQYSDPDFNPAHSADFQLYITLNETFFSYAVLNPVTKEIVQLITDKPVDELFTDPNQLALLSSTFQKTTVALQSQSFCLIPNAVFTPENLLDFAAFLVVKEADVIMKDQVENGENTVIYTFQEQLIRRAEAKFKSAEIVFAPKSWIKAVFEAKIPGQNLYLYLAENQLQLLFPDQENIRFYNQFFYATLDEVVYYTALVADQLKLKPAETTLILCGNVGADSEPMLRLQAFFKEATLFTTPHYQQENNLQQHQVVQFLGLN
jgi:hypothetical protein